MSFSNNIFIFLICIFSASFSFAKQAKEQRTKEEIKIEKEVRKSHRAMWIAHVLREKKAESKITGLKINLLKIPVFLVPKVDSFRPLVKLKMDYKRLGWTLFDDTGSEVRKSSNGSEYTLYAYLNSRISTVNLTAKGPDGEEEKEMVYLFAPEAREFKTAQIFNSFYFTVGHSYLVYRQKSFGRFVSESLLLGLKYMSPEKGKKFGYLGGLSSTVYTYDSSPEKRTSNFIEGRIAGTYKVKLFKNPKFRSRAFLGLGTINLFSLGSGFGFKGLYGPNMGVHTEYYKSGVHSYSAELQYMPYEFKDLLSERTLKLSLAWNKNLDSTRKAQLGFSYSNHEFKSGVDAVAADLVSVYFAMSF